MSARNSLAAHDAPARSGVEVVLAAADKIAALPHAVAEIRQLHTEVPCRGYAYCQNPRGVCRHCKTHMPCPTIAILEEHEL